MLEKLLYVVAGLCRDLHICESEFADFGAGEGLLYGAFSVEVAFVADDHDEGFFTPDFTDVVDPFAEVTEGVGIFFVTKVLVMSKTMTAALESLM